MPWPSERLLSSLCWYEGKSGPGNASAPQLNLVIAGLRSSMMAAASSLILGGEVMTRGGITKKLVRFSSALVGHFKGSHAQVTILSSMLMAGVSGQRPQTVQPIGSILIPSMLDEGYDKDYAVASTGLWSTIGPIIPPSIMMVIYGSMTSVSVGQMFIGRHYTWTYVWNFTDGSFLLCGGEKGLPHPQAFQHERNLDCL